MVLAPCLPFEHLPAVSPPDESGAGGEPIPLRYTPPPHCLRPVPMPRDPHTAPGKIAFLAAEGDIAQAALERLAKRYKTNAPTEADVVVVLGGDGFMLQTLHQLMGRNVPIFGMNRGSVGFLLNEYREEGLVERLKAAGASFRSEIVHGMAGYQILLDDPSGNPIELFQAHA